MTNTKFMKSMDSFKEFMTSEAVPNYVNGYCLSLMSQITFFYVLKWILKNDFHDIAYEMYCLDMSNPEMRHESLIRDSLWKVYSSHYFQQYQTDFELPD